MALLLGFSGMALVAVALYASEQMVAARQDEDGQKAREDGATPPYKLLLLLSFLGFGALIQFAWLLPAILAD